MECEKMVTRCLLRSFSAIGRHAGLVFVRPDRRCGAASSSFRHFSKTGLLALVCLPFMSGCATLINLAINPQGVANQAITDTVRSISDVNVNDLNSAASGDIDRILREHPEAANRAQLTDLKANMDDAKMTTIQTPKDDLQQERAAEHDRRLPRTWRHRTDKVVIAPLTQYYAVPYGIRTTPRSHYPQNGLSLPESNSAQLDTELIRFER